MKRAVTRHIATALLAIEMKLYLWPIEPRLNEMAVTGDLYKWSDRYRLLTMTPSMSLALSET